MARKLLLPLVAVIIILAMVLPGCEPAPPAECEENWQPVELRLLIRSDLAPYPQAGHWFGDQLELLGFKVVRDVKTGALASPIWVGSHPSEGKMHVYTGGWSSPAIPRDAGSIFDQMYTHRVMAGYGLWEILEEQLVEYPAFDTASRKIRFREYTTMVQRKGIFETALWEAMEFSNQIWVMDVAGTNAYRPEVRLAVNTAGGIGDPNWIHTLHFHDALVPQVPTGETTVIIEINELFTDPWNPVAGSSWTYDMFVNRRGLGDAATMTDPGPGDTGGLEWPLWITESTSWHAAGLPIGQTIPSVDWGDGLYTIEVSATDANLKLDGTAWGDLDYDDTTKTWSWISVEDRFGTDTDPNQYAKTKTVVKYSAELWNAKLHDGTTITPADFLVAMAYTFDRGGNANSPVYEPTAKGAFDAWLPTFKGVKVEIAEDGVMTITTWSDMWYLDAELFPGARSWFPQYGTYGWTAFWHTFGVGFIAESKDHGPGPGITGAFTKTKADTSTVPWLTYVKTGDPALTVLDNALAWAEAQTTAPFIPYKDVVAPFYTDLGENLDAEIGVRWAAMRAFYTDRKHFWVGNGPFELMADTDLDHLNKTITLYRFADYPFSGDIFFQFLDPAPVSVPAHTGAWVDKVEIRKENVHAQAVAKLKAGTTHVYAFPISDPLLVIDIKANLSWAANYGSYRDLRFNTYRAPDTKAPFFAGEFEDLNVFAIPEFREAMNWLLNRPYMVGVHLGGAGSPKWTALGTAFPDHARYYDDIVGPIETAYAYNFAKAKSWTDIIMGEWLGCELRLLGTKNVWHFLYPCPTDPDAYEWPDPSAPYPGRATLP